jgi:16S rRNA (cytosine967-C5)-methyltransferase
VPARSRAAAARALAAVLEQGSSLGESLQRELARAEPRDRALIQQLCYGTLRGYFRLDGVLQQTLQKKLKRKDSDIHALLLIGLHQLYDMRTPDHAALSSTVEACRTLKKPWATGLVNGILRRCLRESEHLFAQLDEAQRASHPPWLLHSLQAAWPEQWPDIVEANNSHPPMCLRVNRRKASREDYLRQLEQQGFAAQACTFSEVGVRLEAPVDVELLPGFARGLVSVQDEAAQLAAALLAPAPGDRVLDACSAPGGKTCHLLELQPAIATMVAMDSEAARLRRVNENLARLELDAQVIEGDARHPPAQLEPASFDRILVDAPCSGSGVIRRHPDIKLLRRADDIPALAATQVDILGGVWPLLREGGTLLYATCSVLPEENLEVVTKFIAQQGDAVLQPISAEWGVDAGGARQLLSAATGTDGMFYALLRKQGVG